MGVDEYTVLFHDDDELDPRYHQTLVGELERNPTYAAVACNARKVIDNRLVKGSVMRSTTGDSVLLDPTDLIKRYFDISPIGPPPLCSYMIRSAIMKNLSFGWEFGGKYSDVLALASVVRQGPVKWLHEPLVRYRIHSGQDSRSTSIRNYRKLVRQIVTQGFLPADSPLLDVYRFKHFRLQVKNMQKPENHKRLQVVRRFMFAFVVNRLLTKKRHLALHDPKTSPVVTSMPARQIYFAAPKHAYNNRQRGYGYEYNTLFKCLKSVAPSAEFVDVYSENGVATLLRKVDTSPAGNRPLIIYVPFLGVLGPSHL